ncbi:hypothetical protein B0H34DRAFT_862503 [Crassisporium funariophilum]|nr:hypothetical protein B0H34DRAFT_862503 [Crassisporium funariophilum]
MLCNFSAGVDTVSFLNLQPITEPKDAPPIPSGNLLYRFIDWLSSKKPPGPPDGWPPFYRVIESGSWHNNYPGETRIQLDYSRLVSFYDTALFPSLQESRTDNERWDHRLEDIRSEDILVLNKRLGEILSSQAWGLPGNVFDWRTLLSTVADRYADRLEMLHYILNSTYPDSGKNLYNVARVAQGHVGGMLTPYMLLDAVPPHSLEGTSANHSWASPVFKHCATTHTQYLSKVASRMKLTYSELLLLGAVKGVEREICRVLVGIWAEGVEQGLSETNPNFRPSRKHDLMQEMAGRWKTEIEGLMAWLDWSHWVKCRPACGFEETCYLPTWPFFIPPRNSPHHLEWLSRDFGTIPEGDDWRRPKPRCIRRIEPFGVTSS